MKYLFAVYLVISICLVHRSTTKSTSPKTEVNASMVKILNSFEDSELKEKLKAESSGYVPGPGIFIFHLLFVSESHRSTTKSTSPKTEVNASMVAFEDSELKEKLKAETHRCHLEKMKNESRDKLRNLELSQNESAITLREETVPTFENLIIAPGADVSKGCGLKWKITIGANNVIDPKASIIADCGPIIIGNNNVIGADVLIYNAGCETREEKTMVIGDNNVMNVGAHVESLKIGNNNVLGANCYLGRCIRLTNNCVIGAKCQVDYDGVLNPNTVIPDCS